MERFSLIFDSECYLSRGFVIIDKDSFKLFSYHNNWRNLNNNKMKSFFSTLATSAITTQHFSNLYKENTTGFKREVIDKHVK